MFNKVNGNSYTITSEYSEKIVNECKAITRQHDAGVTIEPIIYQMTIRHLVAYRIAMLAITHIKEAIVSNGFIAVTYTGDISSVVSVGWIDDKLVYDDLIK